ncbi:MAG: hypothetical protein EAZ97_13120 [Bacteroidetes bacterium]|nr:MAG: hypothetical protein EAZ97_13120 [Bacteroidota bacterium]
MDLLLRKTKIIFFKQISLINLLKLNKFNFYLTKNEAIFPNILFVLFCIFFVCPRKQRRK